MCASGKLEKVLFPLSTCEGGSSDHHLKTPSRKVKLAYPYIKEKDVVPLGCPFSPPLRRTPKDPGRRQRERGKEEKRVHQWQPMKSPFTALKKKTPLSLFLKYVCKLETRKVLFPFSTCEGVSSDHHLKFPSRKVKLAYPYIKRKRCRTP